MNNKCILVCRRSNTLLVLDHGRTLDYSIHFTQFEFLLISFRIQNSTFSHLPKNDGGNFLRLTIEIRLFHLKIPSFFHLYSCSRVNRLLFKQITLCFSFFYSNSNTNVDKSCYCSNECSFHTQYFEHETVVVEKTENSIKNPVPKCVSEWLWFSSFEIKWFTWK